MGSLISFSLIKTASGEQDAGVLKSVRVEFGYLRSRACKGQKTISTYTMGMQEGRSV